MSTHPAISRWLPGLRQEAEKLLSENKILGPFRESAAVLLHGSTTRGIDDPWSDLDLWLLIPESAAAAFDASASSRFIGFRVNGKEGHFNIGSLESFSSRIHKCDLPLIAELRTAVSVLDSGRVGTKLIELSRQPMTESIRKTWFRYHYVEHRSEHRAIDTPIERGDGFAILQGATNALAHALRAAMVLDGEPYPYIKWLAAASRLTNTGGTLAGNVEEFLDILGAGGLRLRGPEREHAVSLKLKEIRRKLIAAARGSGMDEPWLESWWLYLDLARREIHNIAWAQP